MYKTLQQALVRWNEQTTDRQKLQHTYLATMLALLVAAGLIGLVNYDLSQRLLLLVFIAAGLFLGNLVVWALLQSLVTLPLEKLTRKKPAARTKKR